MFGHEWALVDVETSGFRAVQHRVLSLAVITVAADGRTNGEFSTLLDPGCDPGPVHVHGLTAQRLKGAPKFRDVAKRVSDMLADRVLVGHNAPFDYGFLAQEFRRANVRLPVERRLCTLALNRRLSPATSDLKLATLAAHYGVLQRVAHDALEDVRTLTGVLRGSLAEAARLGLSLPLVACPPKQQDATWPRIPKTRCAYRCPGPLRGELVQGMKVAMTGATDVPREQLVERAVASGLNVMTSVSRHTSVLVTNDVRSGSEKARRALEEGIPIVNERTFLKLLDNVRAGTPHGVPKQPRPATAPSGSGAPDPPDPREVPEPRGPHVSESGAPQGAKAETARGPLEGRRILVVGGRHPDSCAARGRVVELGGAAAVNLSASVTDVVALTTGPRDRRMGRVADLGLPVHTAEWLGDPERVEADRVPQRVLPRGAVVDLPGETRWTVAASWVQHASCEVDVVAFVLDEDGQVSSDDDFVFYNAAESPDGAVRLAADGPTEQAIGVDLAMLPAAVSRVTVAAAIDGTVTFGQLGAVEVTIGPGDGEQALAQATLDAGTSERTMLLAEFYRRGGGWRLRMVGQGYDFGLDALARGFGVAIDA